MTQEHKQLLLKDLCARLAYGVKVHSDGIPHEQILIGYIPDIEHYNIKPYLRPMSSMTEEEKEELYHYYCEEIADNLNTPNLTWDLRCCISNSFGTDWLNAHHFDYRGLIDKGLALEAPKGM